MKMSRHGCFRMVARCSIFLVSLALAAAVFAEFIQKKVLFQPTALAADYQFRFDAPFEEVFLEAPDGPRINALWFKTDCPVRRGVVLYLHGNRDNLQRWGSFSRDFTALGWDFFAIDYRGYGKSTGEPDEAGCYIDGGLAYDFLRKNYPPEQIVIFGRSLGSGVATHLAARVLAKMLVLETPFDNVRGIAEGHLGGISLKVEPAFRFPNDENLSKTTMPVLIFHGTRDRVVPLRSAQNLKRHLKPGDEFVVIEGGSHNDLGSFELYREKLVATLD